MKKIDSTVKKETLYIAAVTLILSVMMQAVFLIINKWELSILLANLLGAFAGAGNFFLMGLTVQSALGMDAKDAKSRIKLSQMLRTLLMFVVAVVGYIVLHHFNKPTYCFLAVVIPFIFPRIAIAIRTITMKKQS